MKTTMSTMLDDFPTATSTERCRDVHLDNGEAIREMFTGMLRTDEGIDFSELLGQCGLSRRATKTLTDHEARELMATLALALKPAVVTEGGEFFLAVCQVSGGTLAELAQRSEVKLDALEAFCRGEGMLSRAAFAKASEASIEMATDRPC